MSAHDPDSNHTGKGPSKRDIDDEIVRLELERFRDAPDIWDDQRH